MKTVLTPSCTICTVLPKLCIDATCWESKALADISIGKPIANTRIYILDAQHQPQPPGLPGELCIAGRGLARGYLHRPELTADKFIEVELFGKPERVYKTGDLARWLPDGNLEYLGRLDHQVKLRGFRIELGEIEAVLSQHEAVKEAVVTLNAAAGNPRLVAYLTMAAEVPTAGLTEWLKARLPDYMIPSQWVVLEKLPLTPNGKIDRQALPAPDWKPTESYEAPRNEIEQQLAQIWSRLLKQTNVSIHDNFFNLGGDSILSIQIVAQARQAGFQLTPRDLFQHQTIAELATVVRVGVTTVAEPNLIGDEVPLTPIQHWFFAQEYPEYWHFNQSLLLRVPTDLQLDALRQLLVAVLSHHDMLRSRYTKSNGAWQQTVSAPADHVPLVIEDLRASPDPVAELSRLTQDYQARLNLTTGPVTYLVFFNGPAAAWLFWCIHHLVVDGVSWRILQADLHQAYTQLVAGQRVQLPAKTSSFQAWANRLVQYASSAQLSAEVAYWQALPNLSVPRDNPLGENRLEHQQNYTITLTPQETEALLRVVPVAYQTRINDVLLTALALALADWTGQDRCLLDLEGHGRVALFEELDLSRTVGWFTTIYPVALTLPTRANLGTALKAIKEQLRGIPHDGISYGLLTQLGGQVLPKGEILFNYLGQFDFDTDTGEFSWASESTGSDVSLTGERDHLIDINGAITQSSLQLTWSYSGECYQAKTIQTLADGYQAHLQQLIRHGQSGRQGVTPSDFPLATVTQATLDTLYQQYVGLQDLYPLSPMQQGMLFHTLYEPETGVYFEQLQWTLSNLDPTAFQAAWQHQLERHPILRTAFLPDHTPLLQVVQAQVPLPWREQDWRELTQAEQQSQLQTLLQVERTQGFDFSQAPLMRFDLLRLSEQRYVFIQHSHHILLDGWCLPITLSEVRDSYRAFQHGQTPQLPPVRPYRDYIAWLQRQDHAAAQSYWQPRLAGLAAPTPWPILTHPTATPAYRDVSYALSPADTQRLQRFSQTQRVTLNTLVQGAWAVLLSRYSRETTVCFGVTVSGRHAPVSGIEQMMGLFINTLPLLVQTPPTTLVKDYLQQVQTQHQNDQRYAYSPLFEIQQVSEVPNGTALFDSLLVFENYPLGKALEPAVDSFQLEDIQGIEYTNYPLTVAIVPGESLSVKVTYDHHRLHLDAIERLWGHFQTLLLAMSDHPEQSISQLPMLTESELQQLQAWNDTAVAYPQDLTIVDLFEQQVARTPANIAVVFEEQHLTYQQLNDQANQLAHYLLARQTQAGIHTHNPLIAIAVERSVEMVIGLLGILKAGGAYVPIDPSYPRERLRYLLEDSAAPLLLTQSHLQAQLPTLEPDCVVVCLDEAKWADQPTTNPLVKRQLEDLAYVIYTSGSTGKPKGCQVTQLNVVRLFSSTAAWYQFQSQDVWTLFHSSAFDFSVWELWGALLSGAKLVVVPYLISRSPAEFYQLLSRQQVTILNQTPSAFKSLMTVAPPPEELSLRLVIFGGESLDYSQLGPWFARHGWARPQLVNMYGITETTVHVTYYPLTAESPLNCIGIPLPDLQVWVVDAHQQLLPIGIPGEMYVGGAGVTRGYLNRPELTAEKFIEVELFGKPERVYKTGDLARWLPDGNLEYLGRLDHQVKLRGFRIELGEIEAVLSQHDAVKEAVVTLNAAAGNPQLVAYLTTAPEVPTAGLKEWLKARLPDYMIPSQWVVLEKLPLTPNGKIDRKALPSPVIELTRGAAPATPTEALLASLWANVLKRETIQRQDNFFELGGHSLLATQLVARIRDSFQVELPVRAVFEHPQLADLSTAIETATGRVRLPPIVVQPATATQVLSFAQQRLWFLNQLLTRPRSWSPELIPCHDQERNKFRTPTSEERGSSTYNMPVALRLSGPLAVTALQHSLHWLVARHDSLRTVLPTVAGQAQVWIQSPDNFEVLRIQDLRSQPTEAQPAAIQRRINQHALAPFDLAQGPLFKAELLLMEEQQAVLLLNWHHIISDGWSMGVFIREWQHAYTALAQGETPSLPPLAIQYQDYAAWQRQWLQGEVLQQQLEYWRNQLAGLPEVLDLPTDKPRPAQPSYQGAHYAQSLSTHLTSKLTQLSQQQGVTVFMTWLSAFYLLLSRYARQDDLAVGSPIANRTHSQTENLLGFFVNTLVLRGRLSPQQTFLELLRDTRHTCLAAYTHQDLPFEMLVEQLQPTRSLSHSPLFQVMLVLQNNDPVTLALPGLEITTLEPDYPLAKFDLTLSVEEREGQFHCSWEYATDLFAADTIARMADRMAVLLTAIVENPTQVISRLPMLIESELQQLQAWNDTAVDYPQDLTIVDLFEQQVVRTPANLAVVFEDQQLTYQQLNDQANQLAHYLLARQTQAGIPTHNPLIAIAVERSVEMVIGLLGILKAGGAYVPIDPSYPRERIRYLLEDSAAPLLLTQSHLQAQLPTLEPDCVVVYLDEAKWADQPTTKPDVKSQAEDLVYVIYTSGSTGQPKGTDVGHQGFTNLVTWFATAFQLTTEDNVLVISQFSFDLTQKNFFAPLLSGSRLHLLPSAHYEPNQILQLVKEQQITWLNCVPSAFYPLLEPQNENTYLKLASLRYLFLGGEPIALPRLRPWLNSTGCQAKIVNSYGPTECTDVCAAYRLEQLPPVLDQTIPIGKPIFNVQLFVLGKHFELLPVGVAGELYVAGVGLARGYLHRPELTAEKFIEVELFGKPERVYKTGDLARWLPDGNLEYLGRLDHQVKLRGFRIELGEIEAVLSQHEAVKEVVVTLNAAAGNPRLVAYLTTAAEVPTAGLKEWLTARLPDYMVPSQFVVLAKLPLTPNGKIDRQALPSPVIELTTGAAPATPTEALLATLWANVLKREPIQRQDNFFELGGHSLLATQLVARIRDSFQVELPVRAVFEHPQLADLSTAIETATGRVRLPPIVVQPATATKVLSFAQQRLWFLNQLLTRPPSWSPELIPCHDQERNKFRTPTSEERGSSTYNMPAALRLSGPLTVTALQDSLHWLVARHDSLRTVLPTVDGQAQVWIQPLDNFEVLRIQDLRPLPAEAQPAAIQGRINQHALAPFDLAQGPLFKAELLLLEEQQAVLLLNWHHIISDGWSMGVFIREWQQAYTAFAQGETPNLPPLAIQYQDYAAWQRQWLQGEVLQQQLEYWRNQLASLPEVLDLPTDKPRPAQPSYQGAHYAQSLSTHLTSKLTQLSQQQGVTVFMTWLSAFYLLLSRYARQDDIAVGSPIANRTHSQTENLLGFFVNTLVLRGRLSPQQTFLELLRDTRHTCLAAYAHQDLPFEMLVEQLQPTRSLSHSPLFQVMLVLQNNDPVKLALPGLEITALEPDYPLAKFDLTLSVEEREGQFHCRWEYATDLFAADTIARMADRMAVLLTAIVENPTQVISQLPMLTTLELQQFQAWNDTAVAYPQDLTMVDLFEQQVAQTPANIAVVFENQQLTYRQLNDQANQLAHYLLARQTQAGIQTHNPLMAIAVERSVEMVIGLLGILKAGGAYVPIDPSYPRERIRYLLEDSAAPLLLTQSHLQAQLPTLEHDCVVVCLDEAKWANQPTAKPDVKSQAEDLAYVIYTSGSTGKPKGVMIEHSSVVNLLSAFETQAPHTIPLSGLFTVPFSFDLSVWEIFSQLCYGGALHILSPENLRETDFLVNYLRVRQISSTYIPPAFLELVAQQLNQFGNPLQRLLVGVEPILQKVLQVFRTLAAELHIINGYGPTEATVCATFYQFVSAHDGEQRTPIGKPVANYRIYILNADNQPQPPGLPGELCIAGRGLARGYLHRPELTAEKFIEVELFGKPERVYKTGDLARWLPDGNLEYLGRLDHQVKLRGFRIELGEIEAVLTQHEAVKEVVVTLNEAEGNPRLVAYLTTAAEVPTAGLKEWLKARLPDYMIPSQWVVLAKLPLTPNGKIDRQALPAPDWKPTESYEAPRNEIEQQLAQIWSRLLKQTNVSIHDNFFNLGGDSILSIQIVAQARQAGFQLTPRDLFQHQTIAELATVVRIGVATAAKQGLVRGEVPLTPIQHWFFAQELPEFWHFNQSLLLCVPTDLQIDALRQAFAAVLLHHDALRCRYTQSNGTWQQTVSPPEDRVPLLLEDLRASPDPVAELSRLTQDYQARLNLTTGPVTYLVFFNGPAAWLFWCIHHLVVDGVSWRILQADLQQAYTQLVAGQRVQLPAKTSSFQAWANRLVQYASSAQLSAELAYWQALPSCTLPREQETGENRLEHQQNYTITLTPQETEALLRVVPVAYQTRINDVLLTALALALADWTGQDRCLLDLEGHGRVALFEELDLSRTVGWFTTIYPVALTLPTRADLGTALKAIKEQLRGIPHDGIGYGLLTQLGGQVLPKGEILFNYLGQFDFDTDAGEFRWASESTGSDVSLTGERDHLIDINGAITQGSLQLTWSYSGDCYQAKTIQTLADGYQAHLQQLIRHGQSGRQGVTPSDFPLATVTQATLDTLYQQYVGLQDLYPLSPMQQGMLFHSLYEPETGVYFEQLQWTLSNLDPTAFQAAWQHQLERHPILRTAFLPDHTPLLQVVQAQVPLPWREQDWRELAQAEQQSQLQTFLRVERTQGFDLSQAPLMRFDLIRVSEQRYVFIQHFHHILLDGWCLPITLSEVRDSYRAFQHGQTPQLPTLRPYRDYIAWLQRQDQAAAQSYWQPRLAGLAAPTPWPILTHPTATPSYRDVSYALSLADTQRLQRFSQTQRVTLNTLVQGAWAVLLSRYSRDTVVCFGVTVSGRHAPVSGIEQMMGLFINTLPLLVQTPPATLVKDYLQQVQTQHQNDQRYAYSPLFEIQQVSEVPNGTALFDSLLVFENYPLGKAFEPPVDSFQLEDIQGIEYTNYPLTVAMVPGEALSVKVTYDHHRLHLEVIERLWGHFQTLLLAMSDHPEQSISQLPMLTESELQQLQAWNDTAVDYPQDLTIVDLFEQQVAQTPDNIAVVFEDQHLTYQQLNDQANQLAHYLLARQTQAGIQIHNPLIAIAVERSVEMVIGLLGILKAGGAYVPIDPSYPRERLRYLLEDSASPLLLTQSHLQAQLPTLEHDCVVVCLDEAKWADQPTTKPAVKSQAEDLAYVIYTSGSTGKPKGVMVEQTALCNFVCSAINTYSLTSHDHVLQFAAVSFDAAAEEIYPTLLQGATLILRTQEMLSTTETFLSRCGEQQITVLDLPTAYWYHLLTDTRNRQPIWPKSIRLVLIGGEAVAGDGLKRWQEQFGSSPVLFNTYGPTETTVVATLFQFVPLGIGERLVVPIGHPIANTRIYILDAQHQPQPPGLPGELCIAGRGLARGYLHRPELTADKFIEVELFGKPERIYKTGDLACWLPDGNLEYLGRLDHQVKLRGFRIELGEIEAVLSQHDAVKEAVVTLNAAEGNPRLVAYLTTAAEVPTAVLKEWLKARLPDYMVPSQFVVLEQLPLTPNGKIDRKALPSPVIEVTRGAAPATPTEVLLASLWANVLKRETIQRQDNFFELGGHSLLATQLVARIRDSFQVELPVRAVFEHPQLADLSTAIEMATGRVRLPPIVVQPATATQVLSFAQQRLWFLNQLEERGSSTYNMPAALRLSGPLAVTALQHSLHWLVARHDSLRTVLPTVDGQAQVRIQALDNFEVLRIQDLRSRPAEAQPAAIQSRVNQHALAPFDLAQGPLFKAELLLLEEQQAVLLLNWHHIISDGWSMGVFIREWQQAYTAFAQGETPSLPPLAIQYQDYAAWQRQWLQGEVLQQQLEYWRNQLAGLPEVLDLPTDKPRPAQPSYQGAHYAQSLSTHLTSRLTQMSQQQGVTVFMTWLSAFYLLLSRYARQDDIAVGSPIANRTHSQTETLLGFFVNTLVLRGRLSPQQTFLELLRDTRHTCLAAYAHQDLPFEMLVEQLQPTRSLSHSPLFQVMLVLQNNAPVNLALPGLEITTLEPDYPLAKFDLTLSVEEREGQFHCSWEYATDLFAADTIARMADRMAVLLTAIVENPTQVISRLPMLTTLELQQLQAWNDTAVDYPQDLTIVDLFEQQVARTPANIAVVFEEQQLTYQQLNDQANQLAHYLLARQTQAGIPTHNPLIAIAVERSVAMVIGLLGILKAGGAYVPIDPSYPRERLRYLLADSAAPLLLTQSHLQAQLPTLEHDCVMVYLDEAKWADQPTAKPDVKSQAGDLAYVIYTSGSTGKPKGVMVEHQALTLHGQAMLQRYVLNNNDKVLQFASMSFDIFIEQLLVAWLSGASVVLVKNHWMVASEFLAFLKTHALTVADLSPGYWQQLLELETLVHELPALRMLILGGEALLPQLARQTRAQFPTLHLVNAYGPTESVITSTSYRLPVMLPENTTYVPIGRPRANTRIYILDAQHQPQPPGLPGELCIAGRGLARGYLNRPELTAEKFIAVELFGKTERVYKTGDLARWLPDGNLEYLGRLDHQVKLRGFRIELGEIEAVLSQHDAVKEVVVTLNAAEGNPRLVAYLTTAAEVPTAVLKEWLKARLPDYMIPSQWVVLEKLPLTPNGKIDRKALPSPVVELTRGVAPATPTEALLATLWANVLKRELIQRQDNFFELGGHSLLATQLVARIRDSFQVELPVRVVFEHPQLADLSTAIEMATGRVRLPPIVVQPATATKVLSFAQQRLWFLNQLLTRPPSWSPEFIPCHDQERNKFRTPTSEERGSSTYNMPAALRLSGPLTVTALQDSLHWLVARHDSLRTVLPTVDGQAQVRIQALDNFEVLRIQDLRPLPAEAQPAAIQRRINQHALAPFDLDQGPLFKAELLLLEEQQAVLLLNWHHIISDGWSMGVFIREWQHAYTALAQGETPSLPPLAIQYQDYAAWQRQWLQGEVLQQQLDYWRNQLAGLPEVLDWPTDKPRPAQPSYQGAHYAQSLSTHLTSKLTQLSQQQGVTVFMTWLSAFYLLLSRYARQDDIAVGSPIANRTHSQTENLLGFFVNTLVLRGRLSPQQTFLELLRDTRHTCLAAYTHQDLPFEMLVEQLQPTRSLSHSPLFQVMLVLQNNDPVKLALPGLEITALEPDYPLAKFDLTLSVEERDGQFHCSWEYATDLFAADTIARMADRMAVLLTAIVENPTQVISQLPILTTLELQQLQAWNDTAVAYPQDLTIVDLFEQQVAQTPDNIAVVFEEQQLTYQQLNDQANQLAQYLLARQTQAGIHLHNPLIAIAVERSLEMVIGLLGILKAGGAYVPIDPSYPRERLRYLLEDSAAPLLLTQSHLQAQLPTLEHDCVVVCLDEAKWVDQPTAKPDVKSQAEDLAYVIYTSGSTGKPKGAMNTHSGIVNRLWWMQETYQLTSQDRVLQKTPFSFDVSVWEFFWPLVTGAGLVLARPAGHQDPSYLTLVIATHQVTVLHFVPSMLAAFLSQAEVKTCRSLKRIICSGEALSLELTRQVSARFQEWPIELHNLYGPTEAAVDVSHWTCRREDRHTLVPIGKPVANTQLHVLDANHQMVPIGVPGELGISGVQVCRGYLNRPELTAEKFIEVELFGKPERIYKTGDLARWLPDGNLEYLGRLDHQVKLRGFRIELGEIEAVLSQHEAVKEAVVTLNEAEGNPRLVAYLTTATEVPTAVLKEWLKARLPDYMIPSQWVVLEKLPLTPNGKIDRQALPSPDIRSSSQKHYQTPRNTVELQLAQIWEQVLEVRPIGIFENFFELGGHSLLAVRLMAQIEQQFQKHLPLTTLFQHATIEQLATILRQQQTEVLPWSPLVAIQVQGAKPPLFCVHPGGGNVLCYVELAQSLGMAQPVYGLQAFGMEAGQVPYTQVIEIAQFYLHALQTLQPQGPYQLVGWSFGGLVAFEIARQLQTQGESVSLLALLDTVVPAIVKEPPELEDDAQFLVDLFREELSLSLEQLRPLTPEEQLTYVVEQGKQVALFPPEMDVVQARRLLQLYKTNAAAGRRYQPQLYQGPIILFQATEDRPNWLTEPDYGWQDYATAGVAIIPIPGNHENLVKSPQVQILAEHLKSYLK